MRSSLLNLLPAVLSLGMTMGNLTIGHLITGNLPAVAMPISAQNLPSPQTLAAKPAFIGVQDILAQADRSSAAALITQPISISSGFTTDTTTASIEQVAETIPSAREQAPQLLTPFDVLKNPNENLERFLNQAPPTPETPAPLEFFKIPGLEGSLKMNVSNF